MSTQVHVQNNTIHTFAVRDSILQSEKYPLPKGSYQWNTESLSPGVGDRLLDLPRDSAVVKYNQDYEFHSELSLGDDRIELRQKLRGTFYQSKLWYSAGPDAWLEDYDWHRTQWNTARGVIEVLYRAALTAGDDAIEYIINPVYASYPDPDTLNVLAYNVYLRPTILFANGQVIRAGLLPERIKGYDVIVFSEMFDDGARARLLDGLSAEYPFQTRILGSDEDFEQDGGVVIVSRWPIQAEDQVLFEHQNLRDFSGSPMCHGDDCLAEKGVLYARISNGERTFHIFGTHLQAGKDGHEAAIRGRQLLVIQSFIDSKQIPAGDAVVIAGDFNIESTSIAEYPSMLQTLRAIRPLATGYPYSVDPQINPLSGSEKQTTLDYVLYSRNHLQPVAATGETRLVRSQFSWKEFFFESKLWDLSDHFPVHGRLQYGRPAFMISPPLLDLGRVRKNTLITRDRSLTVSSVGSGPVVIRSVRLQSPQTAAFTITPQPQTPFPVTLQPRQSFPITIHFRSAVEGEHQAQVAVTGLDLSGAPVTALAVLLANVIMPDMDVLPLSINYGPVPLGQQVIRNVLVTNNGSAPLRFRVDPPTSEKTHFHWRGDEPKSLHTLPPGEAEAIPVYFIPKITGKHSAQLVIVSDDDTVSVSLSGEGVPAS